MLMDSPPTTLFSTTYLQNSFQANTPVSKEIDPYIVYPILKTTNTHQRILQHHLESFDFNTKYFKAHTPVQNNYQINIPQTFKNFRQVDIISKKNFEKLHITKPLKNINLFIDDVQLED